MVDVNIPTISNFPAYIIMDHAISVWEMYDMVEKNKQTQELNKKEKKTKIRTKKCSLFAEWFAWCLKKLGSYFVNTYIFVKKYKYCIMQVIS